MHLVCFFFFFWSHFLEFAKDSLSVFLRIHSCYGIDHVSGQRYEGFFSFFANYLSFTAYKNLQQNIFFSETHRPIRWVYVLVIALFVLVIRIFSFTALKLLLSYVTILAVMPSGH